MRRRDFHLLLTLWISLVLNVCAVSFLAYRSLVRLRSFRSELDDFSSRLVSAERTCADACAAAIALAETPRVESSSEEVEAVPVRVLGYGQSKTSKRRYIYRDTQLSDGTSSREIVRWFPLNNENPSSRFSQ